MIPPINLKATSKAGIAPIPKPPQAVSFTSNGNAASKMKDAKDLGGSYLNKKIIPSIKKAFDGIKAVPQKIKTVGEKALKWVKDIKISDKISKAFKSLKDLPIIKNIAKAGKSIK